MYRAKSFLEVIFLWMLKHRLIAVSIFVFAVALSAYMGYTENIQKKNTEAQRVERGTLIESVPLTGTVKPTEEANLSFEKSGIVKNIFVSLGDTVEQGQTLASLNDSDDAARVMEARANLMSQQAQLSDLQSGSKEEAVAIKRAGVMKAQSDLVQAYQNTGDSIKNLSISANTYVRNNFASYFNGSYQTGYTITIASCDSNIESQTNILRKTGETALLQLENLSAAYDSAASSTKIESAHTALALSPKIFAYLDSLNSLLSENCISSNASFDSGRATIASSRNSWNTLSNDVSLKLTAIQNAQAALSQAQNDLALSQSGEKSDKVKEQEAQVKGALARLASAQSEADKNVLKAPFSGIITNMDLKKGELVSPGSKSISMISDSNFQIESKVSEVDVAKLKVGATSTVHFDAYGDNVKFTAVISNISLAGIITDGVPTYKTIFNFIDKDERIRSGMTANIDVVSGEHANALFIPARFVKSENGRKYVNLENGGDVTDYTKQYIETGIKGMNGEVEVVQGLREGNVVQIEK